MSENGKNGAGPPPEPTIYEVERPAGGTITVRSAAEAELYTRSRDRYIEEYGFHRMNDMMLLGSILAQQIEMFRAEGALQDETKAPAAHSKLMKATDQVRELEKALGIDKKTRDAGGQHTLDAFIAQLKRGARAHGIHIAERTKWIEGFIMELSWRVRLLKNGDAEDRRLEGLTEQTVIDWCEQQIEEFHSKEKEWAHEVGKVFVGIA